jgi:hypothetical protein
VRLRAMRPLCARFRVTLCFLALLITGRRIGPAFRGQMCSFLRLAAAGARSNVAHLLVRRLVGQSGELPALQLVIHIEQHMPH